MIIILVMLRENSRILFYSWMFLIESCLILEDSVLSVLDDRSESVIGSMLDSNFLFLVSFFFLADVRYS